jgi:hypothetical protein
MYYEESRDFLSPTKGRLLYSMTLEVPEPTMGEKGETREVKLVDPTPPLYPRPEDEEVCVHCFASISVHGDGITLAALIVGGIRHDELNPALCPETTFHIDAIPIVAHHITKVQVESPGAFRIEYKIHELQNPSPVFDYWFHQPQYQPMHLSGESIVEDWSRVDSTPTDEKGVFSGTVRLCFNHPIKSLRIRAPLECKIHDVRLVGLMEFDDQRKWEWDGTFMPDPKDAKELVCSFEPLTVNMSHAECPQLLFKYSPAPGPACVIADAVQLAVVRRGMFCTRFSK